VPANSPAAQSSQARLENHLRELFGLDTADLDFGLYRLFALKREEVKNYISDLLPARVERAFAAASGLAPEELSRFERLVAELARKARAELGPAAIAPDGELDPVLATTKPIKDYLEARQLLAAVETSAAQRDEVFNLLFVFFSRYYDEGDFVSRRFYGARSAYAIPYNGEETLLWWANADQYYVKTGETFRDYAFTVEAPDRKARGDYRVRFVLQAAADSAVSGPRWARVA